MRGHVERLRWLATSTRVDADWIRLLALRVRAVGAIRWRSEAANHYRVQVEARARRLELEANEAHELARSIDHLADMLERRGAG